ncbi:tight junction-associated protein 1 isoform X1 [Chiloscyllium punctatum]|uniref:tight junction-associated protein 1 isoform X1 n=1 Tax=Chiloscyllium punctatum TaxID=137246 RepID=UPI003B6347F3
MISLSEDEHLKRPLKTRSSGRSLVFKEPAQVLAPRGLAISPTRLPLKGILKQANTLGVQVETLRKARSAEMLAQSASEQSLFPSEQISKGSKDRRASVQGNLSPQAGLTQARHRVPHPGIIEEKLRFSKFLDEITFQVLSPHNLQSIATPQGKGQIISHCSNNSSQDWEAQAMHSKRKMRDKTGEELVKGLGARRRNSLNIEVECRKGWQDTGRPMSPSTIGKQFIARKDDIEKHASMQTEVPDVQREIKDSCQSTKQTLEVSDKEEHPKTRLARGNKDEFESRPHYLETGVAHKAIAAKYPADLNPSLHSDQDRHLAALQMVSSIVQNKEPPSDEDRIRQLQQQNQDLREKLTVSTNRLEIMERDFESSRHYLEAELSHAREEMDKLKDKFRRLQNSYTASQRANQELEDKLHALVKKAELERKTLDWEIVELTNRLLDSKTAINKLEELNERYRQDCNLAVQLLKCNKSHFRNHKFAELPFVLQEMVSKQLESTEQGESGQEPSSALGSSDVVPASVIARVLEKPEPLVLNSAKSSSGSEPLAEDVFVHVDMSCEANGVKTSGREGDRLETAGEKPPNGMCKRPISTDRAPAVTATFEKLDPYPTPPQNLFPGRKAVVEFSSDDKVKIPKDSPLANCTYATRQAISLRLVQGGEERLDRWRNPASSPLGDRRRAGQIDSGQYHSPSSGTSRGPESELRSAQSSPFNSPPQISSSFTSSTSSEEDLLANWQRMFVEKVAPSPERLIAYRTSLSSEMIQEFQNNLASKMNVSERHRAHSDGEESSHSYSCTISRDSSLDTDSTDSRVHKGNLLDYGSEFSPEEQERLLQPGGSNQMSHQASPFHKQLEYGDTVPTSSSLEERERLLHGSQSTVLDELEEIGNRPSVASAGRQQRSPKRMGVHHLLRKDSLTRAQEQGTLLD